MQQLVHHPPHGAGNLLALGALKPGQPVVQTQQLGLDHVGGPLAQGGHRRGDLSHPLPCQVSGNFVRHDVASGVDVGGGGVSRGFPLHPVHIDDPDAGQPGHRRVDIPRHPQVAHHQRVGRFVAARGRQRIVHIGQRNHRADRPGAADHDVGRRQCVGQPVEGQRLGPDARFADIADQPLRPGQRPVEHEDVPDAGPGQVRGRQRAHRAGADQHSGLTFQPAQPALGHAQDDRHHGSTGRVDSGFGMHPLAHRERPLGQLVQYPTDGTVALSCGIRATHLAKHLLLADHRRVQTAGNREQMLDGGLAVADVGVFGQIAHRHPGVFRQHLPDYRQSAVERVHHRVDLDPVARRKQHDLGHQRRLQHPVDDLDLIGFVDAELFQDGDRRTAVRNPEEQDAHGSITWAAPLLFTSVSTGVYGKRLSAGLPNFSCSARSARSRASSISQ